MIKDRRLCRIKDTAEVIFDNTRHIFNLVTKKFYWEKPSYDDLETCLQGMKDYMIQNKLKKLAMPKIATGLDRLQWERVRSVLANVFKDVDILIKIYYL